MSNPRKRSDKEVKRVKEALSSSKDWVSVPMGKILNKVAKEERMPPSQIREIFEVSWFNMRETLREHEFPVINIEGFGRLLPRIKQVKALRGKYLEHLRLARNKKLPKEVIEKRKKRYEAAQDAVKRIEAEMARRKSLYTKDEEE